MVMFPGGRPIVLTRQKAAYGAAALVGAALVVTQAVETRAMLRASERTLTAYERTQTLYQENHGLYRLMLDHVIASHFQPPPPPSAASSEVAP